MSTYRSLHWSHIHLCWSISTGQGVVDFIHDCLSFSSKQIPFTRNFTGTRSSHIHDSEDNLSLESCWILRPELWSELSSLGSWQATSTENPAEVKAPNSTMLKSLAKNKVLESKNDIMDTCSIIRHTHEIYEDIKRIKMAKAAKCRPHCRSALGPYNFCKNFPWEF